MRRKKTDASDPDGRHIPTCMVVDGAFKYDQYESALMEAIKDWIAIRSSSNSNITLPYLSIAGCYESYEIIKHTEFRSFWRSWLSKTQVVRFARFINHLREYMRKELISSIIKK